MIELKGYTLEKPLSRRPDRELWLAVFEKTGRRVAVKILKNDGDGDDAAVAAEAEILSGLRHPNVARMIESGRAPDGSAFTVMEYVKGKSLEDVIRSRVELSWSGWADVFLQAARGLRAAYLKNVIHCDVKPSNVMIDEDAQVRIVDFGLARRFRGEAPMKSDGRILGTPRYMSPEHCLGRSLDHRSDIYSLGATLYHCLAGRPPFDAPSPKELMQKHISAPLEPLYLFNPGLPEDFSLLAERMMQKDPARRFQDYDALSEALEEVKLACLSRERGALKPDQKAPLTVHEKGGTPPGNLNPSSSQEEKSRAPLFFLIAALSILGLLIAYYLAR